MAVSVVILAAGSGTRMRSQTPKVLHKICGQELLFFSIQTALALSDDIHIVLFHQKEKIQERVERHFGDLCKHQIHFHIQDHQNFPGTGGALLQSGKALQTKHSSVLVLNGDMPLITPKSLQPFLHANSPIVLGVIESQDPFGYGRVIMQGNCVTAIIEEKDADVQTRQIKTINSGIYLFSLEVLQTYLPKLQNNNAQKEYYLTDIIKLASNDSLKIQGIYVNEEEFSGINDKAQLSQAQEVMLNRLRKDAMQKGVLMHLPQSIYLEVGVQFEGECEIEQGAQLCGNTRIAHSHIKAHSCIKDSFISHSSIGPMAHIRPNSHICNSHIGNFVEVKNSKLQGIKAGHLSYLGDSFVDEGTNVGAGVITCNYDGKNKHQTWIGKNVFIGSDTQLIAPLKIADHTLIGAGSTISKDSQSGDLLLSRIEQKNLKNGYHHFFKDKK